MPSLIFEEPQTGQETEVALGTQQSVTIGRSPGCDLRISQASVGRKHAEIVCEEGEYVVRDLDSSNGTYVNGRRIERHVLSTGDRIYIGDVSIGYNETGDPDDTLGADRGKNDGSFTPDDNDWQMETRRSESLFERISNRLKSLFS